eukprot:5141916-Heterocapsa_arctica.AAC.1
MRSRIADRKGRRSARTRERGRNTNIIKEREEDSDDDYRKQQHQENKQQRRRSRGKHRIMARSTFRYGPTCENRWSRHSMQQ